MVSAECSTATETTAETAASESLPTTIVGQSSFTKEKSASGGESAPQAKQSSINEETKVASNVAPSHPQPVSAPSSAPPSAVSSPSASVSASGFGSPARGVALPVAGSVSVPAAAVASIPQLHANSTGPSPLPPTHAHNPYTHTQNPAMQVPSMSPPPHPSMQAHAHPLHPQAHPPLMHHPIAYAPHHFHPAHMYHPHYPPPLHPHMYHPAMWHPHHPHPHHPPNPAAYIKPYSAVMRSQPHIKRTSKYMLMEQQGGQVASPATPGSSRSPLPQEVESSSSPASAEKADESKATETPPKRPASELSNSLEKEKEDVPEDLRNKKMKATDCLLFAASLLAPDKKKKDQERSTDENDSESPEGEYVATGVKPAKKIYQPPYVGDDDDDDEEKDENWPKDVDVLCGRGGLINKHPGNVVYRKIVDYNKPFYQSVHKRHRILVSQSIVQSILNFGGRFMIMEKGKEWTEIEFKRAVQKTSQALRERIITAEELKKEEEKNKNGGSKRSESDEDSDMGDGEGEDEVDEVDEDDEDDEEEDEEEEVAVKKEKLSENMNGIAKGALAA